MFFSVVIPLFNKQDYVHRAIRSVLAQTHANFELIIVDDGSTDNSAAIVKAISDIRIKLIQQVNGGVSKARNTGAKFAKAGWIAFLDADDEYDPDFLKEAITFLKSYKEARLSFLGANYFLGTRDRTAMPEELKTGVYDYYQLFGNQRSPSHSSTTIVNKIDFLLVGGFPEGVKQFEDWITWFKLGMVGDFGYIGKPLGFYHSVEGSVARTKRNSKEFYNDAVLLSEMLHQYLNKEFLAPFKRENVKKCMNSFALSISSYLARDGAKVLALKMLKFVSIRYYIWQYNKSFKILLHLIIPQFLKLIYRHFRWGRTGVNKNTSKN